MNAIGSGRAVGVAFFVLTLFFWGCGGAQPSAVHAPPASSTSRTELDDRSGFVGKELALYRSDRLGVSFPLPDRSAWTIVDRDDASSGWLVATHAVTSTVVRVHRYDETSLVGRRECQLRATLSGELARDEEREQRGFETLVDEPIRRPKGWDGWRYVAFEPAAGGKLVGHVYLIAGRAHVCLVAHVIAQVQSETNANELADRLELFSSRVVAAITIDRAEEPGSMKPELPGSPIAP